MKAATEITQLLQRLRSGDSGAGDVLMPQVYDALRQIAAGAIQRFDARSTLQPTALVHEAYLKLFGSTPVGFEDRQHFLSVAAMAMRQLLVDHARARNAQKRGAGVRGTELDDVLVAFEDTGTNILDLNDALERFASLSPQGARVVEMRFFGGLSNDEVAGVLGVSSRTVEREWRAARAWLFAALVDDVVGEDTDL